MGNLHTRDHLGEVNTILTRSKAKVIGTHWLNFADRISETNAEKDMSMIC